MKSKASILLAFSLMLAVGQQVYSQTIALSHPCTMDDLMAQPGKWTVRDDPSTHPGKNYTPEMRPEIISREDKMRKLIERAWPIKGMEGEWTWEIYGTPLAHSNTVTYGLGELSLEYRCDTRENKMEVETESMDVMHVYVNHFGQYLIYDTTMRVGHHFAALLPHRAGVIGNTDLWHTGTVRDNEHLVIISRPGQRPFIPVTQREFLLAMKVKLQKEENQHIEQSHSYLRTETDRAKSDRYWAGRYDPKLKFIDDYLANTPAGTLEQPAIVKDMMGFQKFFTEQEGGRMAVITDSTYFQPGLKPYFPQFIVIGWMWNDGEGPVGSLLRSKPPDMATCCRVAKFYKDSMDHLDVTSFQALLDK